MPPAPLFLVLLYVDPLHPVIWVHIIRTARFLKYMNKRIKIEENYTIRDESNLIMGGFHMKKFIPFLVFILLLTACAQRNEVGYRNDDSTENNKPITVKNSNTPQVERKTGQQISKHLVNLATSVPNVKDATAVVLGNYAIVGIDLDGNVERSEVGTIKYSVAESLKNDPYGAQAIIVADPDLYSRIQEVGSDIENGKPIQGIMNELSDITGRVMPEIPRHLEDSDPENAPKEPDKKMHNQKEKQLNKEQEDQSQNKIKSQN